MIKIHDYHDKTLLPFPEICRKVREGENFTFARYGDGEFNAILKVDSPGFDPGQANCDGHEYFEDMGEALKDCFLFRFWKYPQIPYYIGLHMSRDNGETYQVGYNGRETVEWLAEKQISPEKFKFAQNAVFHDACGKKHGTDIRDFYDACVNRRVIIVGPARLRQQQAIKPWKFIECPLENSWLKTDHILTAVNLFLQPDAVVLFCAGMPSPVWIDRLYSQYGTTATFIDFGSALDQAAGLKTRSFHKQKA